MASRAQLLADIVPICAANAPSANGVESYVTVDVGHFDLVSNTPLAAERNAFFHESCVTGLFKVVEYRRLFQCPLGTLAKLLVPRMLHDFLRGVNSEVSLLAFAWSQVRSLRGKLTLIYDESGHRAPVCM